MPEWKSSITIIFWRVKENIQNKCITLFLQICKRILVNICSEIILLARFMNITNWSVKTIRLIKIGWIYRRVAKKKGNTGQKGNKRERIYYLGFEEKCLTKKVFPFCM